MILESGFEKVRSCSLCDPIIRTNINVEVVKVVGRWVECCGVTGEEDVSKGHGPVRRDAPPLYTLHGGTHRIQLFPDFWGLHT